jgi:hypothetical protein
MKIKYRIVNNFNKEEQDKLERLGINVSEGWDSFEIDEHNQNVERIKNMLNKDWDNITQKKSYFSEKDRTLAPYLNIYSNKMLGYAKTDVEAVIDKYEYPFDLYPYYKGIFEIIKTDKQFGILRGNQNGYYFLENEPNWGGNDIASANYIEDAFFVKPEVYEKIFRPLNIKSLPVINYKTQTKLENVVQIVQQGISKSHLIINKTQIKEKTYIKNWNIDKYVLSDDSYYPSFDSSPGEFDFFYTHEYFGTGGLTQRNTIISKKLYSILKTNNIKGLNYYPMKG